MRVDLIVCALTVTENAQCSMLTYHTIPCHCHTIPYYIHIVVYAFGFYLNSFQRQTIRFSRVLHLNVDACFWIYCRRICNCVVGCYLWSFRLIFAIVITLLLLVLFFFVCVHSFIPVNSCCERWLISIKFSVVYFCLLLFGLECASYIHIFVHTFHRIRFTK